MKVFIRGSSITAKMCALMLDINELYVDNPSYKNEAMLSTVLSIKTKELTPEELSELSSKIDISKYLTIRSAGFLYKGKIHDAADEEMTISYLKKQGRKYDPKTFKFETSYEAIDLMSMITDFSKTLTILPESSIPDRDCIEIRTNIQVDKDCDTKEYISIVDNDIGKHSYVYDCDEHSINKRITSTVIEHLCYKEGAIEVKNYYDPPKMTIEYDFWHNKYIIYIGRYATKSRIEQVQVIRACKIIKTLMKEAQK